MLSEISIRDVVLIDTLDLDLAEGFSAMTGETGAGKSIILDALSMATGARSDKGLLRKGASQAQCVSRFELPKTHAVWDILEEFGLEFNKAEDLVLRRTLKADGRSRAYINDNPVSAKLLALVGAQLLEIHGQHDGRGLLDASTHRELLDRFGGLGHKVKACEAAYTTLSKARTALETLQSRQGQADDERAYYLHAIEEIDKLAPRVGEDEQLASERKILQISESALSELEVASQALSEDSGLEARLSQALSSLERLSGKLDAENGSQASKSLTQAVQSIEKVLLELDEASNAVADAAEQFVFEPGHLDSLEKRLFSLRAVARKYDVDVDGLSGLRAEFGELIEGYERIDADILAAKGALDTAMAEYQKQANALTQARQKAAAELGTRVADELAPLKLERARFVTEVLPTEDGPTGRDKVRFLVSTNPGTALGPLNKVASGGELSRFALAIKVALAGASDKVMVFDEIDQGVGGAVADAIGKRLAQLARDAQVLVVTHSPQIAASAHSQYKIHKTSDDDTTVTSVETLGERKRVEEIARMLAGETVTDAARKAAEQLIHVS